MCIVYVCFLQNCFLFFFKQKTAYEMRISDWSSDVCSSDLYLVAAVFGIGLREHHQFGVGGVAAERAVALPQIGDFIVAQCQAEAAVEIGRASCRERVCQYV